MQESLRVNITALALFHALAWFTSQGLMEWERKINPFLGCSIEKKTNALNIFRYSYGHPLVLQPFTKSSKQQCRGMVHHFFSHPMAYHCREMNDMYSRGCKHWILSELRLIHRST